MKIKQYPKTVDLHNCEDEPIHLIPQIQSHGFLFVVDSNDAILQISSNVSSILGKNNEQVLKENLKVILSENDYTDFKNWKKEAVDYDAFSVVINNNSYLCIPHTVDNQYLLDFEPDESGWDGNKFQQDLLQTFSKLSNTTSLQSLVDETALQIKNITGYDRVMVYRFDKEWNGTVVAEAKEPNLTPFKGLKYPASDIPKQARALFLKKAIRILADVDDEYHAIIPQVNPETGVLTSVSKSNLRGSSPIHIEYLKNMGVGATLNCTIIHEGKLWGLISCHHYQPKYVNYRKRQSCEILTNMFSAQIGQKLSNNYIERINTASSTRAKITKNISKNWDIVEGVTAYKTNGLSLLDSVGFAILHNNEIVCLGKTPTKKEIFSILEELHENKKIQDDFFASECLLKDVNWDKEKSINFSGILVCKLSNAINEALIWFRPEQPAEVNWGGDPNSKTEDRLSPRKSFEKWTEQVSCTAKPWLDYEISSGRALSKDIKNVIVTKFGELELLNRKLNNLNQELESFSYSVSHDLRGPLRGIDGFAQILLEDYETVLDEDGKESLNIIINSANKMNVLMDEILNYSSINQYEIVSNEIDVKKLCNEIIIDARLKSLFPKTKISIQENIPNIYGDKTMTYQLFANLIGNAFKYSSLAEKPFVSIASYKQNNINVFTVSDNGIGFDQKYANKIFGIFTRLESSNYEGSGVGLAIAQRVVLKQNGDIWAKSEKGKGSTFYFHY
ncbi:ATP-binding protein [Polaribacter sp.]|nr:ATP-binding protein [Polaribacter sp.]